MKYIIFILAIVLCAVVISFDKEENKRSYTPILKASATLDFPNTAAGTSSDLTISLTGAVNTDVVVLGVDNAAITNNSCYTAWVNETNTVTVRFSNVELLSAHDPASGTFKVMIIKN